MSHYIQAPDWDTYTEPRKDSVHNGRTADLQNIFSEATEKWGTIQTEWDTFVARCYRKFSIQPSIRT